MIILSNAYNECYITEYEGESIGSKAKVSCLVISRSVASFFRYKWPSFASEVWRHIWCTGQTSELESSCPSKQHNTTRGNRCEQEIERVEVEVKISTTTVHAFFRLKIVAKSSLFRSTSHQSSWPRRWHSGNTPSTQPHCSEFKSLGHLLKYL